MISYTKPVMEHIIYHNQQTYNAQKKMYLLINSREGNISTLELQYHDKTQHKMHADIKYS